MYNANIRYMNLKKDPIVSSSVSGITEWVGAIVSF